MRMKKKWRATFLEDKWKGIKSKMMISCDNPDYKIPFNENVLHGNVMIASASNTQQYRPSNQCNIMEEFEIYYEFKERRKKV